MPEATASSVEIARLFGAWLEGSERLFAASAPKLRMNELD
jgi:hypothetical protein